MYWETARGGGKLNLSHVSKVAVGSRQSRSVQGPLGEPESDGTGHGPSLEEGTPPP